MIIFRALAAVGGLTSPVSAEPAACNLLQARVAALETRTLDGTSVSGGPCRFSINETGGTSLHCLTPYPYRSDRAAADLAAAEAIIRQCRPQARRLTDDGAVNHPDTYALTRWRDGPLTFALALKDKADRGQTLLVVSIAETRD